MYPFPQAQIESVLAKYSASADVYWVQEEPRNMGPWRFIHECLQPMLDASQGSAALCGTAGVRQSCRRNHEAA